ncbi:MAG: tRNA (N6-isopentenyl adenosine(37)-C2)-methylthiotransferase MiaB [Nitrosomonadales bacterium]|nr:tRNA (N6-isopentenyl adenosine(37)-C2)-methylthiotransferase MiaB [Nitrosomonadales bacterium]
MTKKIFIKTFGCQMNEYDSEQISNLMGKMDNYQSTDQVEDADLVVLNTCSIREKAEDKVYGQLGRLRKLKNKKPSMKIAVGGCVASQEGENIIQRAPYVDLVFGPQTLHKIPSLLKENEKAGSPQIDISFPAIEKFDQLPQVKSNGPSAYISIMEGCSKYCSFCVVPYTRGEEVSRPAEDIIEEVLQLTHQGVIELNLLGQNVNAYRYKDKKGFEYDFAELVNFISEINEIKRIRFTTSHPNEMNETLIECFQNNHKLANFIHLPIQSGSDRILSAMKRNYLYLEYKQIIKKLKTASPDILISSDFIVGFPGETDHDHQQTVKAIKEIDFDYSYSFLYSPRPGTPASYLKDTTPDETKKERLQEVQSLINEQGKNHTLKLMHSEQRVLVDEKVDEVTFKGKADNNRIVQIHTKQNILNQMVNVKVTKTTDINTCGPLDENIQEIAKKLDIKISRNGFKFSLAGADQKIKIASDMLEHFYLKAKTPITLEDIQLSLVSVNEETDSDDIGLIDLKTKKNGLQGRTPRQQSYLKLIQENDINFGIGPAGTGKTYLAVASAIDALNREKIKRIVLVRPAVEAGEKLGFLPGDLAQKVDPYLRPLYDALYDLGGYETVNKWFEKQIVEIAPLAYMRGRTLNQSFIILDEAQNTTPEQMKMFLTRIGFGTKAVITGDITQIDLNKGQKSGLLEIERILKKIQGISFTKFQSKDVVRHPIVQKIIDAYDKIDND